MADVRFAVIGGGIAGASVAYHLAERTDDRVAVFEQASVAGATTARSWAMFGYYGGPTQYAMKRYGMALYNEFAAEPEADPRYSPIGMVEVATSAEGATRLRERAEGLADDDVRAGAAEFVEAGSLREFLFLPTLRTEAVLGALHRPGVGYLTPQEFAREFVERARGDGATFHTDTRVTGLVEADGAVAGVETADRTVEADHVICAAGPWTPHIVRTVGAEVPVKHTLAPTLELQPRRPLPAPLPYLKETESGYGFRGVVDGGTVLVGNQPGGYDVATEYDPDEVDDTVPDDLREGMWDAIDRLLPALGDAEVVDERVGVRSATPDGDPIVGPTAVEGLSVVAFSTSGIQLSPAAGRVIAERLVDGARTDLHDALSVARFDGYEAASGTRAADASD